jgi:protein SCO1/2
MAYRFPGRFPKRRRAAIYSFFILGVSWSLFSGCGKKSPAVGVPPAAVSEPANPSWPLVGEILDINPEHKTLLVHHEEVKGFMPAMTMEFRVNAGDLAIAKKGSRIRATLVEYGDDFYLEHIWPEDEAAKKEVAKGSASLESSTLEIKKRFNPFLETGEVLPEFVLYDQDGRVLDFARLRGKRVALNFIYSRCPVATMCPASTLKMQALQKAAREAGITDFELLSVSLDPGYDTPGVLKEYALVRGIDTSNFSFLTGPEAAVKNLITQLGVLTYFEEGVLKHSLSTLLIGADGKILHREDGTDWEAEVFIQKLKRI